MNICAQCGKHGKNLWVSKNGLCEKCAWNVYTGLSPQEKEALSRGISPLDSDYVKDEENGKDYSARSVARNASAQRKPFYKIWWVYVLVGVAAAVAVTVILLTGGTAENSDMLGGMEPMEGGMVIEGGQAGGSIVIAPPKIG